ncbi:MAG: alpha-amylase family glycosyl hydrolase [Candidatus Nanopelagicales bacterium]
MIPGWLDGCVWWHVYPLGFSGAEANTRQVRGVVHRLRHLAQWLDYARDLGVSGLQLGPVFASQTHGYDTTDHLRIDHRLGDDADFDALVAGCHQRGMRVLLDGVFNHVGSDHPLFQAAVAAGPNPTGGGAAAARWFRLHWEPGAARPRHADFEGHQDLVALNHAEPAVSDYVVSVMNHWLDRGADGWRLDAAYAVPPAFWRPVVERVKQRHPDSWIIGEVIHGEPVDYLRASGLDGITAYTLWRPLWRAMNDANLFDLSWQVGLLDEYAWANPPMTFAGNHDVTRLASQLTDQRHFGHAIAALMTLPGSPSIYYGDEQAFRGVKEVGWGGDDAVRPMFPDRPDGLAPWGWPIYHLHARLITMRRRFGWLTRARASAPHVSNIAAAFTSRPSEGGGRGVTVLLNISDDEYFFPIDLPNPNFEVGSDGMDGTGDLKLVPAHSWRVVSHD